MAEQDLALQAAENYRNFNEDHPWLTGAMGFLPVIGSAQGVADLSAALKDPRAGKLETALASLGIVPGLKGVATLVGASLPMAKAMLIGARGIERVEDVGQAQKLFNQHAARNLPMAEIMDAPLQIDRSKLVPGKNIDLEDLYKGDEAELLFTAYPHLRRMKVDVSAADPKVTRSSSGVYDPRTGSIGLSIHPDDAENASAIRGLFHETQHAVQDLEGLPIGMRGTSPDNEGWLGYLTNWGERSARTTSDRAYWSATERMDVPYPDHMRAEQWRVVKNAPYNLSHGRNERPFRAGMSDPGQVASLNQGAKGAIEGGDIPAERLEAMRQHTNAPFHKRPDVMEYTTPSANFPMYGDADTKARMFHDNMRPDRAKSAGHPEFLRATQDQRLGKKVPPVTVYADWDPKAKEWFALEYDGLENMAAVRHNYGPSASVNVRVVPVKKGMKLTTEQLTAPVRHTGTLDAKSGSRRYDIAPKRGRQVRSVEPAAPVAPNMGRPYSSPEVAELAKDAPPFGEQMSLAETLLRQMREAKK